VQFAVFSHSTNCDMDYVISPWWEHTSFFNMIIHTLMLHTWHWGKLKQFTGMCSSILSTVRTSPLLTTTCLGPENITWVPITMEMTRQFSRPCLRNCKILKWISVTVTEVGRTAALSLLYFYILYLQTFFIFTLQFLVAVWRPGHI
jgi:hypothetical protein